MGMKREKEKRERERKERKNLFQVHLRGNIEHISEEFVYIVRSTVLFILEMYDYISNLI